MLTSAERDNRVTPVTPARCSIRQQPTYWSNVDIGERGNHGTPVTPAGCSIRHQPTYWSNVDG